jgi:hypothetical protein
MANGVVFVGDRNLHNLLNEDGRPTNGKDTLELHTVRQRLLQMIDSKV